MKSGKQKLLKKQCGPVVIEIMHTTTSKTTKQARISYEQVI